MPTSRFLAALFYSLLLLIGPTTALAQTTAGQAAPLATSADGVAMDTRLKNLEADLRCLVCQNQSLADSPSEWADGMRAQIRDKMKEGLDDEQIIDFLVARYGDFVTYKPPLKPITYVLWFGPIVVLLIALAVVFGFVRRRGRVAPSDDLNADDERRARDLLGEDKS
jgi:cytochrome c-type biogenesis protein CcmH